jgi:Fe2+ transport system protein FeoA
MLALNQLKNGQTGIIQKIEGGKGFNRRLESMNIRKGKMIMKISTAPFKGPLVVEVEGCQMALGRGMASKILVNPI